MKRGTAQWLGMASGLHALGDFGKYALSGPRRRVAAKIGKPIRACPGGRHAWFESDCGPVRKPAVIANE